MTAISTTFATTAAARRPRGSRGARRARTSRSRSTPGSSTASVAAEVGFDSGGIGKGLGADLVAGSLRRAGATAVLVNLGGDLRAIGAPASGPWKVGLDNPFDISAPSPVQLVLTDRALATSTTLVRRWKQGGEQRHHLIDPRTGRPCESDVASVSVVADRGWRAEALAKAALLVGVDQALPLLAANGATGMIVDWQGRVHPGSGIQALPVDPGAPARLDRAEGAAGGLAVRDPASRPLGPGSPATDTRPGGGS